MSNHGHHPAAIRFSFPSGQAEKPARLVPYERLSASHAGLDPLEHIKRELREIDDAIADLNDEATQSGEAQKYATTMLKLMTGRRTDLLAMKKKWLQAA